MAGGCWWRKLPCAARDRLPAMQEKESASLSRHEESEESPKCGWPWPLKRGAMWSADAPAVVKDAVEHFLGNACKDKYSYPVHYDRHSTCRFASGADLAPKAAPGSQGPRGLGPVLDQTLPPDPQSHPPCRSH